MSRRNRDDEAARGENADEWEGNPSQEIGHSSESVLFIIDVGASMFIPVNSEESDKTIMVAVISFLQKDLKIRILTKENDEIGILFFNSLNFDNDFDFPNIYVLQKMNLNSAKLIHSVSQVFESFDRVIGSRRNEDSLSEDKLLPNVFLLSKSLLKNSTHMKRIIFITNNDNPCSHLDEKLKKKSIDRVKETIQDLKVPIDIIPISCLKCFDLKNFYSSAFLLDERQFEKSAFEYETCLSFNNLVHFMRKKTNLKRSFQKTVLEISPRIHLTFNAYMNTKEIKLKKEKYVKGNMNVRLEASRRYKFEEDDESINEEITHIFNYKDTKLHFSDEEIKKLRNFSSWNLKLIGFENIDFLKPYYNLKPSVFLFPVENNIISFSCINEVMLREKKIALASLGKKNEIRMVALLPQEELSENGVQVQPFGFQMIFLPFYDDIRFSEKFHTYEEGRQLRANATQIQCAVQFVNNFELENFSLLNVSNPSKFLFTRDMNC